jgi:hypothetical protein
MIRNDISAEIEVLTSIASVTGDPWDSLFLCHKRAFRRTNESLRAVHESGIDVRPETAAFFSTTSFEKALEYAEQQQHGEHDAALSFLRSDSVKPGSRAVNVADREGREAAERDGLEEQPLDEDSDELFFIRPHGRRGLSPNYDMAYRNWMPSPSRDAVIAVLLFGDGG